MNKSKRLTAATLTEGWKDFQRKKQEIEIVFDIVVTAVSKTYCKKVKSKESDYHACGPHGDQRHFWSLTNQAGGPATIQLWYSNRPYEKTLCWTWVKGDDIPDILVLEIHEMLDTLLLICAREVRFFTEMLMPYSAGKYVGGAMETIRPHLCIHDPLK